MPRRPLAALAPPALLALVALALAAALAPLALSDDPAPAPAPELSWQPPSPTLASHPATVLLHAAHLPTTPAAPSAAPTATAQPFDLAAALDDLMAALRAPDEPDSPASGAAPAPDLADAATSPVSLLLPFAATHTRGEPTPVPLVRGEKPGRFGVSLPPTLAPNDSLLLEARSGSAVARTVLVRTSLAVLAFPLAPTVASAGCVSVAVAVLDPSTGEPVPAAIDAVELAHELRGTRSRRFARSAGAVTDPQGTATLERDPRFPWLFLRARSRAGVAFALLGPAPAAPAPSAHVAHLHWERSLLRPGEPARARLALRDVAPERRGRGEVPRTPGKEEHVAVTLEDEAGHAVEKDLVLDHAGVALLEVPLPADARGELHARARFRGEPVPVVALEPARVAVPREASLRLELAGPTHAAVGSTATFAVHARDPWGAPIVQATVRARVVSERGELLARETVATDDSGTVTLAWVARGTEGERVTVEASAVEGAAGPHAREGAASASLSLGAAGPHVALWADRRFANAGEEVSLVLDARGPGGRRVEARGLVVVRDSRGATVAEPVLEAKEGRGFVRVKLPAPGAYDVAFVSSEAASREAPGDPGEPTVRATARVHALGAGGELAPLGPGTRLTVEVEHASYAPLETARFLVRGPEGSHALLVARDAGGLARAGFPRAVELGKGAAIVPVELDASWVAGGEVEALALEGGTLARASARVHVRGPVETPQLEVSVEKPQYKPNERAVVRVHVEARDALPFRRATVELSLEDEAAALAAERARRVSGERESPRPLGGSAGLAPAARAPARVVAGAFVLDAPPAPSELPLVLAPDAAPAQAPAGFLVVETNENGDAQAQVPLPNAPGKWRVRARVLSQEGGAPVAGSVLVATRKRLSLDVGAPERLAAGETVHVALVVANSGEKAVDAKVSLAATPAGVVVLEGDASPTLSVPAQGSARVLVTVRAQRAGRVKLEAKLAAPGEDESLARAVVVAAPAREPGDAAVALLGSEVAATATGSLVAPVGSHVLVRVASPAATLGDLVASLTAPGEDPARALAPTLLAHRALTTQGEAWEAVAKRVGVSPDEVLARGESGKSPRDPRRSPLFSKARLETLTRDALASLAERESDGGVAFCPGARPDVETTAAALETLVLAKDAGAPVEPERVAKVAAALGKLLGSPELVAQVGSESASLPRARAAHGLALAGRPVLVEAAPPGSEAEVLHVVAMLVRAKAGEKSLPDPAERARALLALDVPSEPGALARRIELALALGDDARALALAERAAVFGSARASDATGELAVALAAVLQKSKLAVPAGSVRAVVGGARGAVEGKLAADDPLLCEAAGVAAVVTPSGSPHVTVALERKGKGVVAVAVSPEREPAPTASPALAASARWTRLVLLPGPERDRLLAGAWDPAPPREGDRVHLTLTLAASGPLERVRLLVPLPAGLEPVPGSLAAPGFASADVAGGALELASPSLAAGAHEVTLEACARLAGDFHPEPLRFRVGGGPAVQGPSLALAVAARP